MHIQNILSVLIAGNFSYAVELLTVKAEKNELALRFLKSPNELYEL